METGQFSGYRISDHAELFVTEFHNGIDYLLTYTVNTRNGSSLYYNGKNITYDPRERLWYKRCKANMTSSWSPLYYDASRQQPVITLSFPITNYTYINLDYSFVGVVAADIFLANINSFLKKTYNNADEKVFIIDSNGGYLIGCSWDTDTYSTPNGNSVRIILYNIVIITNNANDAATKDLVLASQSSDPLVAGVAGRVLQNGCPTDLLIYDGYYLQCKPYVDSIPGIRWNLLILLPTQAEVDHLSPSSPLYAPVIAVAVIGITASVIAILITLYYWSYRTMQLAQPIFTVVVLLGCVLLCISCIVYIGANTTTTCTTRAYLFNLSFTIAFAPLLLKSIQLYKHFVLTWEVNLLVHNGKKKLISSTELLRGMLVFLLADVIIISLCIYFAGRRTASPYVATDRASSGALVEMHHCGYHDNDLFIYTELAYKGGLILIACCLTFLVRHIADAVAGTKILMGIVYNTALVGASVMGAVRNMSDVPTMILVETVAITYCVLLTCVLLTAPVLYRIQAVGDKEAAAEVIDELFEGRREEVCGCGAVWLIVCTA